MNLEDIMERDIHDAEREELERSWRESTTAARPGEKMLAVADWALRLLNTATLLFIAWCLCSDAPHKFNRNNQHAERECVTAN